MISAPLWQVHNMQWCDGWYVTFSNKNFASNLYYEQNIVMGPAHQHELFNMHGDKYCDH